MVDGYTEVKMEIPPRLWGVLQNVGAEHARILGARSDDLDAAAVIGLRLMLSRLNDQANVSDLKHLGLEFQAAVRGVAVKTTSLPENFDRTRLHLSDTRKSTYHGVYTRGVGFIARARDLDGHTVIELGYHASAELAALARYYYYLKNEALAYGEAELECEMMRKIDKSTHNMTDVEIWPHVVSHLKNTGRYEIVMASRASLIPGPRAPQLEAQETAPRAPVAAEPVAIGFEDGELPEAFNAPLSTVEDRKAAGWKPSWAPPTWSNLSGVQSNGAVLPRKAGRPRIHYETGDTCACGRAWPCPRRQRKAA